MAEYNKPKNILPQFRITDYDFQDDPATIADLNLYLKKSGGLVTGQVNFLQNQYFTDISFSETLNGITTDEFYCLDGVTSNIQDQISSISLDTISIETRLSTDESLIAANYTTLSSTIDTKISVLIGTAPSILDTLGEIANAISNDASFANYVISVDNSLSSSISNLTTSMNVESSMRLSGDTSLSSALSVAIVNAYTMISSEISNRASSDLILTTNLSTETSNRIVGDISLSSALSTEIINRTSSDNSISILLSTDVSNLQSQIDGMSGTTLSTSLSTETSNRIVGDNSLSSLISILDTNLSTENSTRISSDTLLSTNLSTEISNRISSDTLLSTNLSTETSSRISSDALLSTNLSTEISNRIVGDVSLSTNVSILQDKTQNITATTSITTFTDNIDVEYTISNGDCIQTHINEVTGYNDFSVTGSTTVRINQFNVTPYFTENMSFTVPIATYNQMQYTINSDISYSITNITYDIKKNGASYLTGACSTSTTMPKTIHFTTSGFGTIAKVFISNANVSFNPEYQPTSELYEIYITVNYTITATYDSGASYFNGIICNDAVNTYSYSGTLTLQDGTTYGTGYEVASYYNTKIQSRYDVTNNYALLRSNYIRSNFIETNSIYSNNIAGVYIYNSGGLFPIHYSCPNLADYLNQGTTAAFADSDRQDFNIALNHSGTVQNYQISVVDNPNYLVYPDFGIIVYRYEYYNLPSNGGDTNNIIINFKNRTTKPLTVRNNTANGKKSIKIFYKDVQIT